MPLREKVIYLESYLSSRKIFSKYYLDEYSLEKRNKKHDWIEKYFSKVISLEGINMVESTTNEIKGDIVDLSNIKKGVLSEIMYIGDKLRCKFLYLENDGSIEMMTLFLTEEECDEMRILSEDLDYLFYEESLSLGDDVISNPNIIVEKIRNKKDRNYVTTKFEGDWTEEQKDTWEIIKQISPRVRIDGKVHINAVLYSTGYLFHNDKSLRMDFINEFVNAFYSNVKNMTKAFDYDYLQFSEIQDKLQDLRNGAGFDGFSFTLDSLKNDIYTNGLFFPMYAYINKEPGKYVICGGRHRLIAINQLVEEGLWKDRKILCMFWDSRKQFDSIDLIIPNIIIEKMLYKLNIDIKPYSSGFSTVGVKNIIDFWIVMRVFEKEMDFLIEKYEDELLSYGIKASKFINPWMV